MDSKGPMLDDWLVTAIRSGNREAERMLVQRHHRPLMAHALRLSGSPADAEDAVQSAWGEIFAGLYRLKEARAFRAWAYRIVTGKCGRILRRERADRRRDEAMTPPDAPPAPDEAAELGELRAAIRTLPPGQRAAIALFYLEGFTVAEVAVALAIPIGTAKTRLMHARATLRSQFEGETT